MVFGIVFMCVIICIYISVAQCMSGSASVSAPSHLRNALSRSCATDLNTVWRAVRRIGGAVAASGSEGIGIVWS
jgi:hypothetical protein